MVMGVRSARPNCNAGGSSAPSLGSGRACVARPRRASPDRPTSRITRVVGKTAQQRPTLKRLDFADHSLQVVQAGMNAVCNEPGGTAYPFLARITEPGFEMAGKTGTAQVHHISKEERDSGGRSMRPACTFRW